MRRVKPKDIDVEPHLRGSLEDPLRTALNDPLPNSPASASPNTPHPFAQSTSLLAVIPNSVEEGSEENDEDLGEEDEGLPMSFESHQHQQSPRTESRSIFSTDIRLDDYVGESSTFAKDVKITGWTSVGDKKGSAYVVYDCVITLKEEGGDIHLLRRYSAFEELSDVLTRTFPHSVIQQIPTLPPKNTLGKYRPTFLDRRRRLLQDWLLAVLLHPETGGSKAVRQWVTKQ